MAASTKASRAGTVPRQGSLPQAIAVLTGVLLTLLGVLGMLTTGFAGFAVYNQGVALFGLSINPLQNLLHLGAGLAGIVLSKQLRWSRRYGLALGAGSLVAFGFGAIAVYNPMVNVLNVDWPANWLHLVLAVLGLAIAVAPARVRVSRRPRR